MRITITDQGYQATIDSLGAELKSYKDPFQKEYIWNGNPEHWIRSSPLLFPCIGNVRDGKTIIGGKEYPMAKHGFAREAEFTVSDKAADQVTFLLQDNENTYKSYPFSFALSLTYRLEGSSLSMTCRVTNLDTKPMYYHLGAHPGFNCPLETGESLSDYVIEFEKDELLESYIYDLERKCFFSKNRLVHGTMGKILKLTPSLFDNDALFFYHTNSHRVFLKNPATGKGICMDYPDFVSIAFWTPMGGKAPFLCLEPWNGAAIFEDEDNNFKNKRDIQILNPTEEKTYTLKISIL